jgi:hypothetical protein
MIESRQTFWMVTILNLAGSLALSISIVPVLEAERMGRLAAAIPDFFWPFELWVTSIIFPQWALRNRRNAVAVMVAMLPLIVGIVLRAHERGLLP